MSTSATLSHTVTKPTRILANTYGTNVTNRSNLGYKVREMENGESRCCITLRARIPVLAPEHELLDLRLFLLNNLEALVGRVSIPKNHPVGILNYYESFSNKEGNICVTER